MEGGVVGMPSGTLWVVDHDVVRKAPLFGGLDEQAAETLIGTMNAQRLERGDVLFHEGDQGDRLYVIGEGKIKLGRTSTDGPRSSPSSTAGRPPPG